MGLSRFTHAWMHALLCVVRAGMESDSQPAGQRHASSSSSWSGLLQTPPLSSWPLDLPQHIYISRLLLRGGDKDGMSRSSILSANQMNSGIRTGLWKRVGKCGFEIVVWAYIDHDSGLGIYSTYYVCKAIEIIYEVKYNQWLIYWIRHRRICILLDTVYIM